MPDTESDICLSLYRMGRLIRRTEEVLMEEYAKAQEMRCPMHFCIGQEGAPAALSLLLGADDYVVSHYRSHGHYLAKGAPLAAMIAEFYGKASGANGGLGGSMELAHHASRFYSGAIVGGPLGIAAGVAFALRYQASDSVAVAVIGDGSLDEGVSYEALTLAAFHRLPLVVICENNLYAAHTPARKRTLARSLTERVRPFGMRGVTLDGCDMAALHRELRPIVASARGVRALPCFVEIETYRYCGHVGPENDDWLEYRSPEEITAWRARDPVVLQRARALDAGITETALAQIDSEIEAEVAAAVAAAKAAPFPTADWSLDQVWSNRYAPVVTSFVRGTLGPFAGGQAETQLKPY